MGDVVTVALDRIVRVLKVTGFAPRRGDADAAAALYEDLTVEKPAAATPEAARRAPPGVREPGSGRPTKRDRRLFDRFRDDGN